MEPNPYRSYILMSMVKTLSNLDRDPCSPTYGSFDRDFWNYKIRDFSSALLQQGCLTLAMVYSRDFPGNIYFKNPKIREYALASIHYSTKIQHRDGSFDEYWVNERSIPATAFTLYAVCEACDILGIQVESVHRMIRRAVQFLLKNTEHGALNQEMASVAAIRYASKILHDPGLEKSADVKFRHLLAKQSPEGWYAEYNGADVGYLTVTLDFLVRYYELTQNKDALESAQKIVQFLKYFVHPDGSIGGEYCTRNTEYFLPYGLEFLKQHEPLAGALLKRLMGYINRNDYLNSCVDERYVLHYLTHSYLKALLCYRESSSTLPIPCDESFEKYFNHAMIYLKSTPSYYFICSVMKGGVFKVMDKRTHEMHTDTGYRLEEVGTFYTSEWPAPNPCTIRPATELAVESHFVKKGFFVQTPLKQTALKVVSTFFGRWVVGVSKRALIYGKGNFIEDMRFSRSIRFAKASLEIEDNLFVGDRTLTAYHMNGLSMRHTASSKFFQINSLNNRIPLQKCTVIREHAITTKLSF